MTTARRPFPLLAVLVAFALMLSACGTADSDDDASADTTNPEDTSTTEEAEPADDDAATEESTETETADEPTTTTTEPAGPPADVIFGFDLSSGDINENRARFGVEGQDTNLLPEDYTIALLDYYNANGGIAGHTIVPLTHTSAGGDVPEDVRNQERCETFFGGDVVADVIAGTNAAIINDCAEAAGAIVFSGGFTGLDRAALDQYPGHVNPDAAVFDDIATAAVAEMVAQGRVAEGTSVGVIYEGCEDRVRVAEAALLPAIEATGAEISAFESTCILTPEDQGTAIAEIPTAVLQWKADEVEVVFNLFTGFIGMALIMNNAEEQGFTPTWVMTSTNEFGALTSMSPAEAQLANTIGIGYTALLDTFELDPAALGPRAQECLDTFAEIDFPAPANVGEFATQLGSCQRFYALETMLTAVPGELDRSTMLDALAASTEDTATMTNSIDWTAGRLPNASYRVAEYDPAAAQFVYTGPLTPFPDR